MKVTRAQIIKALRTEPLGASGVFYETWDKKNDTYFPPGKCMVCAVGGVIRSVATGLSSDDEFCDIAWQNGKVFYREERNAAPTKPLEKLSCFYEQHVPKRITKAFREKLVAFVKREFPATINIKGLKAPKRTKGAA